MSDKGILLVNLGSPKSTQTSDVRTYLREFLSDDRVIDIPKPEQHLALNLFILPFRPSKSAEAYESIWTDEGSPLIIATYKVADALRERVDVPVAVGMRYGDPSIELGVRELVARGVKHVLLVPLYPHYAQSSYATVVAKTQDVLDELEQDLTLTVQPPFFDAQDYIEALVEVARPHLDEHPDFDALLMSYHGVPERHIKKGDPSGCYCLKYEDCCNRAHPAQALCYRHHCTKTTELFAEAAGIPHHKVQMSFQSRLAGEPWLTPYTDQTLEKMPTQGKKRILVMCPAFVSDCLETLEEIAMEGHETFEEAGGKEFIYIPCLNDHPAWISVLERMVHDFAQAGEPALRSVSSSEGAAE